MIRGRVCLAHPDHDPAVPIQIHHLQPRARGGIGTPTVQLCANAHGSVHALLDVIEELALNSPYATVDEVLRGLPERTWTSFTGPERVIAYHGWRTYGLGFLGGRYANHYRLWRTDGTARAPDVPMFDDVNHAARWSRRWRRELERL